MQDDEQFVKMQIWQQILQKGIFICIIYEIHK